MEGMADQGSMSSSRAARAARAARGGNLNPSSFPPGLGRRAHDTPDNLRLHIYFNHVGLIFWAPQQKESTARFLKAIWSRWGTVTDTYYHAEFSYGFVTYATHAQAERALAGMEDESALRAAIDSVVNKTSNPAEARKMADRIFVPGHGGLVLPSWAAPRRNR